METNSMEDNKDRISEIMNLIGYGLAKFDIPFVKEFGCATKTAFAKLIVNLGLAKTEKAVSNRQDSFDPYFDNGRKGWYQRNQREHIKLFIDSLFGNENVVSYANIVKMYIKNLDSNIQLTSSKLSPCVKSKFKLLQETGKEAEFFFMSNFQKINVFENGILEDARLWGDGYDFQIKIDSRYLLAEVKGLRNNIGSIRMTQCEYNKANEYLNDYYLVIISNLIEKPKISVIKDPLHSISFKKNEIKSVQYNYHSEVIKW